MSLVRRERTLHNVQTQPRVNPFVLQRNRNTLVAAVVEQRHKFVGIQFQLLKIKMNLGVQRINLRRQTALFILSRENLRYHDDPRAVAPQPARMWLFECSRRHHAGSGSASGSSCRVESLSASARANHASLAQSRSAPSYRREKFAITSASAVSICEL